MWRFIVRPVGIYSRPVVFVPVLVSRKSDGLHCGDIIHLTTTVFHRRSRSRQQERTCRWTKCAMSAVPLTHCWDEGGVQIAEQLTVLCDLIQPCPGCFIRCGLSLPRCAVMNCPSLRSRWSQTNAAGLALHAKASARISEMNSAHLLQQLNGCQTGFVWHWGLGSGSVYLLSHHLSVCPSEENYFYVKHSRY